MTSPIVRVEPHVAVAKFPEPCSVEARFGNDHAAFAIHGEMDLTSAYKLGGFFDAAFASGYRSIVLDLEEMELMNVAGLRVITHAASRIDVSGAKLTIRYPSGTVSQAHDATSLGTLILH
jgi:anti-anti-sigma factor